MAVPLSTDERRALAIIAALLILAAGARWLERPRPLLDGVPDVDLAALEQASRDAKPPPRNRQAGASSGAATGSAEPSAGRLDPNAASVEELMTLPGVGPALAARIVEERGRAPFRSAADLRRVPGIGAALAARLAGSLSLPERHAAAPPAAGSALAPLGLTDAERRAAARNSAARRAPATGPSNDPTTGRPAPYPPASMDPGPLNLNLASAAELQQLSGVGPVLAARIVARRDSIGGFRDWNDVDAVSGVGPALLARLRQSAVLQQVP